MNKIIMDGSVQVNLTLRELAGYYANSDRDFVCICIAGLADTLVTNRVNYTELSKQVGRQWWTKVLRKGCARDADEFNFMHGWNYGTEYSFGEFEKTIDDYQIEYMYEREYRTWVFEQVIKKFGDVEFLFKIKEHDFD